MRALDLDAIEARYATAACEVGDSDSWRSAEDVPALVAEVRRLRADLAAIDSALDGSVIPASGDSLARRVYERAQMCADFAADLKVLRADLDAMTASRAAWRSIARELIDEQARDLAESEASDAHTSEVIARIVRGDPEATP